MNDGVAVGVAVAEDVCDAVIEDDGVCEGVTVGVIPAKQRR